MYEELNLDFEQINNSTNNFLNNNNEDNTNKKCEQEEEEELKQLKARNKIQYASYNSVLNCLFLLTSDSKLILFDCNSRLILKLVDWSQFQAESKLKILYIFLK